VAFVVTGTASGATPFLISWDHGGSPAYDAPLGGRLVALRGGDTDPTRARLAMEILGVDVTIESSSPRLEATIATVSGGEVIVS
jgi:hypothetical protein